MTDVVSPGKRSEMMSGIQGKNTKPELLVRSRLHRLGFRFRLHDKHLPGKPDLVFTKYRAVVFVHGCFWHRHQCHLFRWPKTRAEFWREKINGNVNNDKKVLQQLSEMGWRTGIIWECSIKGRKRLDIEVVITAIAKWLKGDEKILEIRS